MDCVKRCEIVVNMALGALLDQEALYPEPRGRKARAGLFLTCLRDAPGDQSVVGNA